jgi:hypothetical protein
LGRRTFSKEADMSNVGEANTLACVAACLPTCCVQPFLRAHGLQFRNSSRGAKGYMELLRTLCKIPLWHSVLRRHLNYVDRSKS